MFEWQKGPSSQCLGTWESGNLGVVQVSGKYGKEHA